MPKKRCKRSGILNDSTLLIFGCGGHAKSVADVAISCGWNKILFIDPNAKKGEEIFGFPILKQAPPDKKDFIVAIGDNKLRSSIYQTLCEQGYNPQKIISPNAYISASAFIGKGVFISHHAYIGPCVKIFDNTIINTKAVVEHECIVRSHTHISIGSLLSGKVTVGEYCFIGAGSIIKEKIVVGKNIVIGAGGVVVKNVEHEGIYVGIPAIKIS